MNLILFQICTNLMIPFIWYYLITHGLSAELILLYCGGANWVVCFSDWRGGACIVEFSWLWTTLEAVGNFPTCCC